MKFHTPLFRDNPSLSGGQKQRISLARELVTTPRILVGVFIVQTKKLVHFLITRQLVLEKMILVLFFKIICC